ncbi:hypothetical protein SLA2020_043720 [Shorea laevis]
MEESLVQGKPLNTKNRQNSSSPSPSSLHVLRSSRSSEIHLPLPCLKKRSLALQHHASSVNKATCQDQGQEKASEGK